MPIETSQEFLKTLETSKVLGKKAIESARKMADEFKDADSLARKLIGQGEITRWQARMLLSGRSRLRLGNYLLESRLASTPLGDCFIAVHQQLENRVTIQLLKSHFSDNPTWLESFLAIFRRAAALEQRHLLQVFDIDEEQKRYFVVAEYFHGLPLSNPKAQQALTTRWLATGFFALGQVIQCTQREGYLRGPVSLDEILVDENGRFKMRNTMLTSVQMKTVDDADSSMSSDSQLHAERELSAEAENGDTKSRKSTIIASSLDPDHDELEDWRCFGKAGLDLIRAVRVDVSDGQQRLLEATFEQFANLREISEAKIAHLLLSLNDWLALNAPESDFVLDISGESSTSLSALGSSSGLGLGSASSILNVNEPAVEDATKTTISSQDAS